ncbi:MAG TPA: YdcF family protein [Thermoanaerobaculia bacterium]|nr:YdcF family protein [Thermoanaerobaculia bacterium]
MFLSPGKALTDPLLIALVILIICIILALRRTRGDRLLRRMLRTMLVVTIALWLLSLHVVTFGLVQSLTSGTVADGDVDVIVVPSSGSIREVDLLTATSSNRLSAAVEWWRRHPNARIILCGADTIPGGTSTRTIDLMRTRAIDLGVPATRVALETRSTNTREHPMRVRELPGITRATRIGLVTSSWHMRRTRREFEKHFDRVIPRADDPPRLLPLLVNDFIPSSVALRDSTRMLHEWIGLAWYALRG